MIFIWQLWSRKIERLRGEISWSWSRGQRSFNIKRTHHMLMSKGSKLPLTKQVKRTQKHACKDTQSRLTASPKQACVGRNSGEEAAAARRPPKTWWAEGNRIQTSFARQHSFFYYFRADVQRNEWNFKQGTTPFHKYDSLIRKQENTPKSPNNNEKVSKCIILIIITIIKRMNTKLINIYLRVVSIFFITIIDFRIIKHFGNFNEPQKLSTS